MLKPDKTTLEALALVVAHTVIRPRLEELFGQGKVGMLLTLAEFGAPGSSLAFVTNWNREDAINALEEMIRELKQPSDYIRHVRDEDIPKI